MIDTTFSEIVGQESAKSQMRFLLESHNSTGIIRPMIFIAPKGQGKTRIASAFASRVVSKETGKPKRFIKINCASISDASVSAFIDSVVDPHIGDNEVTLFFDEASEISRAITFMFLTILDPENFTKTDYQHKDRVITFDLSKITWIFATSEPHKIFHALFDRFEHIDLKDYNTNELSQIMGKALDVYKITYENDALLAASSTCRGNGRSAVKMAEKINVRMKSLQSTHFTIDIWNKIVADLNIQPLGLAEREIIVLRHLAKHGECSLTRLSALTALTPQALRRFVEMYLLQLSFIEIQVPNGRSITKAGRDYLALLDSKGVKS